MIIPNLAFPYNRIKKKKNYRRYDFQRKKKGIIHFCYLFVYKNKFKHSLLLKNQLEIKEYYYFIKILINIFYKTSIL
jgi:hypothetical protein